MADEPTATSDTDIDTSADSSARRLMREVLWLAVILVAVAVLDALGRRGLVAGGGYLSSLLLLVLGLTYWACFRIRLPLSVPRIRSAALTFLFVGVLLAVTAIAAGTWFPSSGHRPSVPQMLHLVILVPLAEELYFRGLLLDHMRRGLGAVPAVILSSLLFALMHVPAGTGLPAVILSLIACLLVLKGGSMVYAVQLHVTGNAMWQISRISDMDLRLICAACASAFVCGLAIAARMGSSTRDSVTRPA